ncbi:MAG TPA: hypothetical protein VII91_03675 [Bauldia sp.]|jgi:hypothetical protein
MTFVRSAALGLLFLAAAPAAEAGPAPQAVADMLAAAVAATGQATLTYAGVTGSGDTVTLSAVKLASTDGGDVVSVPSLVVSGVADRQPGGFTASGIAFDGGSATARGETAKWTTGSLAGVVIPTPDEIKGHGKFRPFKAVAMSALALSGTDIATPVVAASFAANIGDVVDGAPSTILVHVTGVKVPMELAANTLAGTLVGLLDYKTLLADVTMDSAYDTAAHTAAINALTIDIADVGKITIAGKASGFSVRALADSQHSADARAAAQLDALSVRLDNAGFVERLLDMQAKMLGGTRDDVRAQLVDGALPFALSFVDNAAFRDQFLAAVTVFLKDPHSLTITFAPAKPVPLGQVMRAAAHRPGTLPDLLTPTVEANN